MSPEDRARRMRALDRRVASGTIQWWTGAFLQLLQSSPTTMAMTA